MTITSKKIKKLPYGKISIPPSKSISHRAVICALLSKTPLTRIKNLGKSNDIAATINGMNIILKNNNSTIDCNESGSTIRFLIPIAAALTDAKITFIGKGKLLSRPMSIYEEIFKKQNLLWDQTDNKITIQGKLKPGKFFVRGDISSQFITGLFFALPLLSGDSEIIITTKLESINYINLTINVLKAFGIKIDKTKKGYKIKGFQKYKKNKYIVEGDYTQASYFLVAKYLGCKVDVLGLNPNSAQGDKEIINIIKSAKNNKSIIVDAKNIPDLVPSIAVLMCFLKGKSKIINASRVRLKECDRLHAMTVELNKIGGNVVEKKDSLIITGVDKLNGGIIDTWGDHRIAMAMAICAIKCSKPLIINEPDVVKKSYPNFWKDFEKKEYE